MGKNRVLVYNTALLTASSILMSCIGMAFQVWLVGRIGSSGIGLFQLVCSVSNLCATFAISGIRFASTRLISEELGKDDTGAIGGAMRRCIGYAAFFGVCALCLLWYLAEPVGFLWVGDARTVLSLRISALSMPCISVCACVSGYFTACGRVWKPTVVHLIEQLSGIALVALFLSLIPSGDIEKSCAAVTLGRMTADILSLLLMFTVYRHDKRRYFPRESKGDRPTRRMLKIAMPLAMSAYARSALGTVQNLLIPKGLRSAGYSANGALSGYGTIQGMVLPIILFPSCIMGAAAELIVPELTQAQMQKDSREISRLSSGIIRFALIFSASVSVFMFVFADRLGIVIYKSADSGRYIRLLAPLIPVMYTDMAVDGCLKGLGQQMWSMGINIVDSLSSLILIILFLPKYALSAYLAIIYITETLNFILSVLRYQTVMRRLRSSSASRPACAG